MQSAEAPGSWNDVEFEREFAAPPVFLASLQGLANESNALPQAPSSPWLTVAVDSVTAGQARIALERSSVINGAISSAESVGWIALDGGQGQFASGAGSIGWSSLADGLVAWPWDSGCSVSPELDIFGTDAVILGSLRSRTYSGGGWLRLCMDSGPGLLVDQDVETSATRGQGNESVSAWILSTGFHTRLLQKADALFSDRFEEEQP